MIDLSIVIPTCNRAEQLRRTLESLLVGVSCWYEVIVVDGASTDGTAAVLEEAKDLFRGRLRVIREPVRQGFTRATNAGFRAAHGIFLTWLNDDARLIRGSFDSAIDQLTKSPDTVGLLALFHRNDARRSIAFEIEHRFQTYRLMHVRGTLYANFALGLRQTFARLGYFDERFYFYGADPDLSLKCWHAGLTVEPAVRSFIDHEELPDARRADDAPRGKADNQALFDKWLLPDINPFRNDFDPAHPCTLGGLRPGSAPHAQAGGRLSDAAPTSCREGPRVTCVLATRNRRDAVLNTLEKLHDPLLSRANIEIIVIDNASTDGTAALISDRYPGLRLICLPGNRGACAKNVALPIARGEFILFLDDDSYPQPGAIDAMVRHFEAEPKLGAASFAVTLPGGGGECSAYPSVFIGCGVALRKSALDEVGGLPSDFFMQAEEYDLSLRLLVAGWRVRRFADLHVHHLKSPIARRSDRTMRLDVRNNLLLIARYFPGRWMLPFARDWMWRYAVIASASGQRGAFVRGLCEGVVRSLRPGRRPMSESDFEQFAQISAIADRLAAAREARGFNRVIFVDFGKNMLPFWLAAKMCGLTVIAIADQRLGGRKFRYRGVAILTDRQARRLDYDAAIIANCSIVHANQRRIEWRARQNRPVIDLFEQTAEEVCVELAA